MESSRSRLVHEPIIPCLTEQSTTLAATVGATLIEFSRLSAVLTQGMATFHVFLTGLGQVSESSAYFEKSLATGCFHPNNYLDQG
jgi:hypothetical protein